jgi:hypothetical protein
MSVKLSLSQSPAHFARFVEMLGTEVLERLRVMFDIYCFLEYCPKKKSSTYVE